jgi:hypothetical protein
LIHFFILNHEVESAIVGLIQVSQFTRKKKERQRNKGKKRLISTIQTKESPLPGKRRNKQLCSFHGFLGRCKCTSDDWNLKSDFKTACFEEVCCGVLADMGYFFNFLVLCFLNRNAIIFFKTQIILTKSQAQTHA